MKKNLVILLILLLSIPHIAHASCSEIVLDKKDIKNLSEVLKEENITPKKEIVEKNDDVIIYMFRGKGDKNSIEFLKFLNDYYNEFDHFQLKSIETWYEPNNYLMGEFVEFMGGDNEYKPDDKVDIAPFHTDGVPYIVIGMKSFKNYNDDTKESINSEIKNKIIEEYNQKVSDRYDIVKQMNFTCKTQLEEEEKQREEREKTTISMNDEDDEDDIKSVDNIDTNPDINITIVCIALLIIIGISSLVYAIIYFIKMDSNHITKKDLIIMTSCILIVIICILLSLYLVNNNQNTTNTTDSNSENVKTIDNNSKDSEKNYSNQSCTSEDVKSIVEMYESMYEAPSENLMANCSGLVIPGGKVHIDCYISSKDGSKPTRVVSKEVKCR